MAKQDTDWISPIGGNLAYFAKNATLIQKFIQANAIDPSPIRAVSAKAAPTARTLIDLGIRGGIRVPHLHFNDKIYMLNDKQWAQFSGGIITDGKTRLAKTKKVSFEQGMLLASATQTLAQG